MTQNCVRCREPYETDDLDPYYCPPCLRIVKEMAIELDKKVANRPKKIVKSDLQIYDEARPRGVGGFPKASDLGI